MAEKTISYKGFIQLEGGLHVCFCDSFDNEEGVHSWMKDLRVGKLPEEKLFGIGKKDAADRLFIVTEKIVAFRIKRSEYTED